MLYRPTTSSVSTDKHEKLLQISISNHQAQRIRLSKILHPTMLRARLPTIRPCLVRLNSSIPGKPSGSIRSSSPDPESVEKATPKPLSSRERIELARSSIMDIFEGYLSTEESFEPIDTRPILADPKKFVKLNTFHRQQVQDEVEKRLRRDWNNVNDESKRMAYFISYGNYDVRQDLTDNCYANHIPEDLPFALPSQIRTSNPTKHDIVKKLPEVDPYQANDARKEKYRKMTRNLDPVSKTVVYLAILVTLIAVYRDKFVEAEDIGEIESPLLITEKKRQTEQDLKKAQEVEDANKVEDAKKSKKEEKQVNGKKWYYLWLR